MAQQAGCRADLLESRKKRLELLPLYPQCSNSALRAIYNQPLESLRAKEKILLYKRGAGKYEASSLLLFSRAHE